MFIKTSSENNDTHQDKGVRGFAALSTITFNHTMSPAYVEELRREKQMLEQGRQRYLDKLEKTKLLSVQDSGSKVINEEQASVMEYLDREISDSNNESRRGRPFAWTEYVQDIPIQTLAIIALSVTLDAASQNLTRNGLLVRLGKAVEMENWGIWLRSQDPDFERRVVEKVKKDHSSIRYRVKAMRAIANKEGHRWERLEKGQQLDDKTLAKLGSLLYNAVLAATSLFEEWDENYLDKNKRPCKSTRVGLQQGAQARIEALQDGISWQSPIFAPMIVPPVVWRAYDDLVETNPQMRRAGCYYEVSLAAQVPLVRGATSQQIKDIKRGIRDGSMQPMLDALNMIQATPMEINVPVLQAIDWAWSEGKVFGKFPRKEHLPRVEFPDDYDDLDDRRKKYWRIRQRKIVKKNRQIDGDRLVMDRYDLPLARELAQLESKAFYIPHSWDFRGRVYPVPSFSHHRGDHIKALFLLHNKKPVGEQGIVWIALKVADLGDFGKISKKPIEERLQWVEQHQEQICEIAKDFEATFDGDDPAKLYWSHADKPFQFLAACIELSNCIAYGPTYESGLPIGLDGSNSGVQHYAAMLRSEVEGKLVNLTPEDRPQDIYEVVASYVRDMIKDETKPDEVSEAWAAFEVGRKTLKRNVMTFPYSSNMFGFRKQIMQDFMAPINEAILADNHWKGHESNPFEIDAFDKDGKDLGPDEGWAAAGYLAKKSWTAVNDVIISAASGMSFLRQLSHLCSADNVLMKWVTPMGFPVRQRYTKRVTKPVYVFLHDKEHDARVRRKLSIEVADEREVDKRKSASSIAPNFVHGLDSSHLHATVLKAASEYKIKDFFLIHDSFATTPADTTALYEAVRLAFVEQYLDRCVFSDLLEQVKHQLDNPEEAAFPEVPQKGNLDLVKVLDSQYCFL